MSNSVAAYESLPGASLAVAHLVEAGFDEAHIGISPRGFHVEPSRSLRRSSQHAALAGAACLAIAVITAEFVELGGAHHFVSSVAPRLGLATLIGAAGGIVLAVARTWWISRRELIPHPDHLVADRYEIVVEEDAPWAGHALANWSDPAAKAAPLHNR